MPTSAQLEGMRGRAATRRLKDLCTIGTPGAATRDGYGEEVAGTPTETEEVPCTFAHVSAREIEAGGGVVEVGDYYVVLEANTQVPSNAVIAVAERDGQPARTFQVKSDLHRSDEIFTRVLCTEI